MRGARARPSGTRSTPRSCRTSSGGRWISMPGAGCERGIRNDPPILARRGPHARRGYRGIAVFLSVPSGPYSYALERPLGGELLWFARVHLRAARGHGDPAAGVSRPAVAVAEAVRGPHVLFDVPLRHGHDHGPVRVHILRDAMGGRASACAHGARTARGTLRVHYSPGQRPGQGAAELLDRHSDTVDARR